MGAVLLAAAALVQAPVAPATASSAAQEPISCAAMAQWGMAANQLRLPTGPVVVDSAAREPAAAGNPAFCKLIGRIAPVDPKGWPIRFEVNLPESWTGTLVQLGGGGTNGVLITGLAPPQITPPDAPSLLSRGHATVGTDAGHPVLSPDPQAFAMNQEAVINQAYGAYIKVHDVAMAAVRAYYGRAPRRNYFLGNSEGGREALILAQRYPKDFDGLVAVVPAMDWTGQHLAHYRQWLAQRDGGWLSSAKVELLAKSALQACDGLDGLVDGVVVRQDACARVYHPQSLACPTGRDDDTCLNPAEMRFVRSIYEPYRFAYPIADGVRSYPGSPFGGEAQEGGLRGALMVKERPAPQDLGRPLPGPGSVRYFFTQDPSFNAPFDMIAYRRRVLELSRLYDPTNPDLSAFARHGKLIVIDYGADYLKSPFGSRAYMASVSRRMGAQVASRFARYYVIPGLGHGGRGMDSSGVALPNKIDVTGLITRWVEQGQSPGNETLRSFDGAGRELARRPLCVFPLMPLYVKGEGFACKAEPAPKMDRK